MRYGIYIYRIAVLVLLNLDIKYIWKALVSLAYGWIIPISDVLFTVVLLS